jgi:hypothetical protein
MIFTWREPEIGHEAAHLLEIRDISGRIFGL